MSRTMKNRMALPVVPKSRTSSRNEQSVVNAITAAPVIKSEH